jgi:hypothetical protein
MRLTVYGVRFDTATMRAFQTGDPNEPTIYIDAERRVFVERVEHGKAVVHWASARLILTLAGRYPIPELQQATRGTTPPPNSR